MELTCSVCDSVFHRSEPRGKPSTRCPDCQAAHVRQYHAAKGRRLRAAAALERPADVSCLLCGGRFARSLAGLTSDFCVPCRTKEHNARSNKRRKARSLASRPALRPCEHCGTEFQPYRPGARFCDPRCRAAARRTHKPTYLVSHGMSPEDYAAFIAPPCAICGTTDEVRRVDHDHRCCPKGGHSCANCRRAPLCDRCNRGLGHYGDSAEMLRRAAAYLDSWPHPVMQAA